MNKNLMVSFAFSLGLHLSTITLAKEGVILQDYLYNPRDVFMKAMQGRDQMSMLFVDTVQQLQPSGARPVPSNVISDNDNVAQDRSPKNTGGDSPRVPKATGAKQLGDTSPTVGPGQPAMPSAQGTDEVPASAAQGQGFYAKKGKPPAPAPKRPQSAGEKKPSYLDAIKQTESDVVVPEQVKEKAAGMADSGDDASLSKQKKTEDIESMRERLEDWMAEQEDNDQDEMAPGESQGKPDVPGRKKQAKRSGSLAIPPGSLKKLSSDENGDVERFGDITFNANKYALGPYFKKLKEKIEGYWISYLAFTYSGDNFKENRTVILFRIYPTGEVRDVKVLEHKGDEVLRDFCVAAIMNTAPYDPLPLDYLSTSGCGYLPIVFTFMY